MQLKTYTSVETFSPPRGHFYNKPFLLQLQGKNLQNKSIGGIVVHPARKGGTRYMAVYDLIATFTGQPLPR